MKKAIVLILAMVLVVSSLASAMAFEAHKVNVKAHVENAIGIELTEIDFGTVFPQEWVTGKYFEVDLSKSFTEQSCMPRVDSVEYEIWASHKKIEGGYMPWLPGLYVKINDGCWAPVIEPPGKNINNPANYTLVTGNTLRFDCNNITTWNDCVYLGLDVPVFDGYYNGALEDAAGIIKPRHLIAGLGDENTPSGILTADASSTWYDTFLDCGVDLWIQVTNIYEYIPD